MSDYYYLKRTVAQITKFKLRFSKRTRSLLLGHCRYSNQCSGLLNCYWRAENVISVMACYFITSIFKKTDKYKHCMRLFIANNPAQICIFLLCVKSQLVIRNVFDRTSSPRELSKNQCIIYKNNVFRKHLALINQGC